MIIGRSVRLVTDPNRKESFLKEEAHRKIVVSIFYPGEMQGEEKKEGRYMDLFSPCEEEFIKRYAGKLNAEGQPVSEAYLRRIPINTYNEIPILGNDTTYPVILYSPGLGMDRDSSMFHVEKLVNAGYLVITIGHLYDASFAVLPQGEIIEQAKEIIESTMEEKKKFIEIRKKDILFLLDEMENWNQEDPRLKGKMNLDKIGVLGHSFGGATIVEAAREDRRIKAAIMLDGSLQYLQFSEEIEAGERLNIPFLNFRRGTIDYWEDIIKTTLLNATRWTGEELRNSVIGRHQTIIKQIEGQKQLYELLGGYKSFIKLKHSEHLTFTDWSILYDREKENDLLSIKRAHEIISDIILRFYDEWLGDIEGAYSSAIEKVLYPEICVINKEGEPL